jgi:signal transduction histidine kinase
MTKINDMPVVSDGNGRCEEKYSRDFISDVAHELRTPVAVLRGSLEALCDGIITDKQQIEEYHRHMLSESIFLQRLVNDLLEYSRLRSTGFEIIMEPVNIADVISDVCRVIQCIASERKIKIIHKDSVPFYFINGDYARLRQMFTVILDNAVKFSPEAEEVTIEERSDEGKLTVSIRDNGCGIAPDELDGIFERFHRVISDRNRNGSGLGLPIAREIAQRHDIKISVSSVYGKGTEFMFSFGEALKEEELEKTGSLL